MHVLVSNPVRFARTVHYLEYEGVRFKLVQNDPGKHADALLAVVPNDDRAAEELAFKKAGKFVSALAWSIGLPMAVEPAGGMGVPGDTTIEAARCAVFRPPQFFIMGNVYGHSLSHIPAIETEGQGRALALFREAHSANKDILSFLLYWQVLDIPSPRVGPLLRPSDWVDAHNRAGRIYLRDEQREVLALHLKGRPLGQYLYDDCRNAIAHLRRDHPSQTTLVFDDLPDVRRMRVSSDVAKDLAERYITSELGLSKGMTLLRKGDDGFPVYIKDGCVPPGQGYVLAYP